MSPDEQLVANAAHRTGCGISIYPALPGEKKQALEMTEHGKP
jgi:hypothetical protein